MSAPSPAIAPAHPGAAPTVSPPAELARDRGVESSSRLRSLDHLRAALTILVVLHHVAVMYGAAAPFYYVEPPHTGDALTYLTLLFFVLFNQAYFMGLFFMISGVFTPGSYDRKGLVPYVRDRVLRLGVPLAAFWLVLSPISSAGFYQMPTSLTHLEHGFRLSDLPMLLGPGPLWFAEMLLIFCLGYAAFRFVTRNRRPSAAETETATEPAPEDRPAPRPLVIAGFVLALAAASYLFRILAPLATATPVLGFPTPAYIPQYLSFFVIGIVAARRGWFRTLPASKGVIGFIAAGVATLLLLPAALTGGAAFLGNGTWQSAAYALWDSIVSVGMAMGLATLFRARFNGDWRLGRFLARNAYAVYVIHIPVIVFLALALRPIHPPQLAKFALAAAVAVPLCFLLATAVRRLPMASRVL